MFGVAGDGCPPRFRMARDDEMRIVVDVLHRRGVLCTVPELFMLGSDRCRVALCADETPPAVLIEPNSILWPPRRGGPRSSEPPGQSASIFRW